MNDLVTPLSSLFDAIVETTVDGQSVVGADIVKPNPEELEERLAEGGRYSDIMCLFLEDAREVRAWADDRLVIGEEREGCAWLSPVDGLKPLLISIPETILDSLDEDAPLASPRRTRPG